MNEMTPFERAATGKNAASSQATAIEQSRAIAEVQGAIVLAQSRPRDVERAEAEMRRSTASLALAERAFYRYKRGGEAISDASIHLARELARCFGNLDYGIKELERSDALGRSEMLAFAWDIENNVRAELSFIVPHKRDKAGGPKPLVEMRDIYENNANQGARRLRECIFQVLPVWFIEEAKERCRSTIKNADGRPIAERITECVAAFGKIGVTPAQLAEKMGRKPEAFDAEDLATLRVVLKSIRAGEATKDEEFPAAGPQPPAEGADEFERAAAGQPAKNPRAKKPAAAKEDKAAPTRGSEQKDPPAAPPAAVQPAAAEPVVLPPIDEPPEWSEGPKSVLHGGTWFIWGGWAVEMLERLRDGDAALIPHFMRKFAAEFEAMKEKRAPDWARVHAIIGKEG